MDIFRTLGPGLLSVTSMLDFLVKQINPSKASERTTWQLQTQPAFQLFVCLFVCLYPYTEHNFLVWKASGSGCYLTTGAISHHCEFFVHKFFQLIDGYHLITDIVLGADSLGKSIRRGNWSCIICCQLLTVIKENHLHEQNKKYIEC